MTLAKSPSTVNKIYLIYHVTSLLFVYLQCTVDKLHKDKLHIILLAAFHHHMKTATCHTFGLLTQQGIVVIQHFRHVSKAVSRKSK